MCYRRRQVGKEPHPHIGGAGCCRSGRGGCRQAERVYGAVSRNKGDMRTWTKPLPAVTTDIRLRFPAELHYPAGRKPLEKGLNVMLEKPMTLTAAQSAELVELAQRTGARLMVGHVLLFHPAYRKIKEVIDSGRLGKLFYLYSNRLNLGTVRTEESVFPCLAPPRHSGAGLPHGRFGMQDRGERSEVSPGQVYDSTLVQLEYPGNVHAHIYVSWLHPWQQLLVVAGSKGMLFLRRCRGREGNPFLQQADRFRERRSRQSGSSDEIIPTRKKMPLEEELRYFVEHLDSTIGINGGEAGYEVVNQ